MRGEDDSSQVHWAMEVPGSGQPCDRGRREEDEMTYYTAEPYTDGAHDEGPTPKGSG